MLTYKIDLSPSSIAGLRWGWEFASIYMTSRTTIENGALVSARGLSKTYSSGETIVKALDGVDLDIYPGDYLAITGPSGCGKSTLLAMLGALDRPTAGKVLFDSFDQIELDDNRLSEVRSRIGFVFQSYNLIHNLTVQENVELSLTISNVPKEMRQTKTLDALKMVGLSNRTDHRPNQLSGGEQQRVAIARAIARDPAYLLLDEPTGNLDSKSVTDILTLLKELNGERGTTIVIVTHAPAVAQQAHRIINMLDGRIGKKARVIKSKGSVKKHAR
jgi:putative ABC transport system ATP-binding protein